MKFTLSWLKSHLETGLDATAIAEKLTALGLEVESVEDKARALVDFTVAEILEANPHPNADKLRVCRVASRQGELQIVCGAPNARAGLKTVLGLPGMTVPANGMVLKVGQIRGVESQGMMCSARELGLGQEHDGIIELPADAPVGQPFAPLLGLDDPLIEIAVTPNRGDCLGVYGIARDLAAAGAGVLKSAHVDPVPGQFDSPVKTATEDAAACPLFAGRLIRGVKNGPSPDWLQKRLDSVGLRPISALVDITNFLSLDRARPLHVYDAAKISGNLSARLANPGETLAALDGKDYILAGGECVIADANGPVGLGGVMGGASSGCSETTTDVFVESALFDPIRTAATGRRHGIDSDARHRFERGVDPAFTLPGLELATQLILEICGGTPSHVVVGGVVPDTARDVELRPRRVFDLGGLDLPPRECARILESLGFRIDDAGDVILAQPPSWRPDIEGEADLVEEVIRVAGLDAIPAVSLPAAELGARPVLTATGRASRSAKRVLAARGLTEAVTYSFLPEKQARLFAGQDWPVERLTLANPISVDLGVMRPSILPNLLAAAGRNLARGLAQPSLFEVGPAYAGDQPADQAWVAGGIRQGQAVERNWAGGARGVDAFDAKADALAVLAALGQNAANLTVAAGAAPSYYHPGKSGAIGLGPKNVLAWFGELHPRVLAAMDVKGPVAAFEVILTALPASKSKGGKTRPAFRPSDLQAVERDFAFVLDRDVAAADVVKAARGVDRQLVQDVRIFDLYQGDRLPEGKKSLALSVRLQPQAQTLTEADIEAVAQKVIAAVEKATGGQLRA